jgi:hypothetical protein
VSFAESQKPRRIRSGSINPEMPASVVVTRFGGLTRFCEWTGFPTSTVWNWMAKGYIPAERQPHVLERAERHGVELEAADFVFQPGREVA